jgi:hypothetical protein
VHFETHNNPTPRQSGRRAKKHLGGFSSIHTDEARILGVLLSISTLLRTVRTQIHQHKVAIYFSVYDIHPTRQKATMATNKNPADEALDSSSDESEPLSGPSDSEKSTSGPPTVRKAGSLQERGRIPTSFYVTLTCIFMLEACSGMYSLDTLQRWWSSVTTSTRTVYDYLEYLKQLMESAFVKGELRDQSEYISAAVVTAVVSSLVGIFIYAPFRAGVWTGKRASRHKVHRYMGLVFLIQYGLAWVEFLTAYDGGGILGLLPHSMALNGRLLLLISEHKL